MKCVRNPITSEIRRLHEHEARKLVHAYGWVWVSKGGWKRAMRPNLTAIKAEAAKIAGQVKPKDTPSQGLRRL